MSYPNSIDASQSDYVASEHGNFGGNPLAQLSKSMELQITTQARSKHEYDAKSNEAKGRVGLVGLSQAKREYDGILIGYSYYRATSDVQFQTMESTCGVPFSLYRRDIGPIQEHCSVFTSLTGSWAC